MRKNGDFLPKLKLIKTEEAVGQILCHDITQIIRGVTKDAVFRKGRVIEEKDIPVLLNLGKDNIYVWENDADTLHENDAAYILRDICMGENIRATEPKEGKIDLIAETDGLFTVKQECLRAVNSLGEMIIATRHGGFAVKKGDKLAGTRVIPLIIAKKKMDKAKETAGNAPLLHVVQFKKKKIGIVTTGSEIYYKRIVDNFTPVVIEKFAEFGSEVVKQVILADDQENITAAIKEMLADGVDIVVCTGGMSVDPDDRTPLAIKNSGVKIVSYGAPVLPGAMFLLAYNTDGRPVIGLPGCVMYSRRTIFDLVLPHILTDIKIGAEKLAKYGEGGLCLDCEVCAFPHCPFGK
jgi:molybdenum cofactor synthesis domain-containing protein